jgi:hypothetical protein
MHYVILKQTDNIGDFLLTEHRLISIIKNIAGDRLNLEHIADVQKLNSLQLRHLIS